MVVNDYALTRLPIYETRLKESEYKAYAESKIGAFQSKFERDQALREAGFKKNIEGQQRLFGAKEKIKRQLESSSDQGIVSKFQGKREASYNQAQQEQVNDFNKATQSLFATESKQTLEQIEQDRRLFEYQEQVGVYTQVSSVSNTGEMKVVGYTGKSVEAIQKEVQDQIKSQLIVSTPSDLEIQSEWDSQPGIFINTFGGLQSSPFTERQLNRGVEATTTKNYFNFNQDAFLPFAESITKGQPFVGRYVKVAGLNETDLNIIQSRVDPLLKEAKIGYTSAYFSALANPKIIYTEQLVEQPKYSPLELEYYTPFNEQFRLGSAEAGQRFGQGNYLGAIQSAGYSFLSGVKGAGELVSKSGREFSDQIQFYPETGLASRIQNAGVAGSKGVVGFFGAFGDVASSVSGLAIASPALAGGIVASAPIVAKNFYYAPIETGFSLGTKAVGFGAAVLNTEVESFQSDPYYYSGNFAGQWVAFSGMIRGAKYIGTTAKSYSIKGLSKLAGVKDISLKYLTTTQSYNKLVMFGKGSPIVGNTQTILRQASSGSPAQNLRMLLYQSTGQDIPRFTSRAVFKTSGIQLPANKTLSQFLYKTQNFEKFFTSKAPKGFRVVERYPAKAQMKFIDKLLGKTPGGFKKQYFDITRNLPLFTKGTQKSANKLYAELFGKVKTRILPKDTFYEPGGSYGGTYVSTFMFQGDQKTGYSLFGLGSKSVRTTPGIEVRAMVGRQAKIVFKKGQAVVEAVSKREAELGFDPSKISQKAVDFRTNKLLAGGRPPKVGPSPKGIPTYRGLFGKETEKAFSIPKNLGLAEQSPMVEFGLTSELDVQFKYYSNYAKFVYGNLGQRLLGYTATTSVKAAGKNIVLPIKFYVSDVAANKAVQKAGVVVAKQSVVDKVASKLTGAVDKVNSKFLESQGFNMSSYYSGRATITPLFTPYNTIGQKAVQYAIPRESYSAPKRIVTSYAPSRMSRSFVGSTPRYNTPKRQGNQGISYPEIPGLTYPSYTPTRQSITYPTYDLPPYRPTEYRVPKYAPPKYPTYSYPPYKPPYEPPYKPPKVRRKEEYSSINNKRTAKAFVKAQTKTYSPGDISNAILPLNIDWLKALSIPTKRRYPNVKTIKLLPGSRKENKKISKMLGFNFDKLF